MEKFKIKKQGYRFVAFDTIDKTKSYGWINIKTGQFVGDTRCQIALVEHLENCFKLDANSAIELLSTYTDGKTVKVHSFTNMGFALAGCAIPLAKVKKDFKKATELKIVLGTFYNLNHAVFYSTNETGSLYLETDNNKVDEILKQRKVK